MEKNSFDTSVIDALNSDQVIAYPTETVWGLGCDGYSEAAVTKVFDIKGRESTKAVSLLVRDHIMAMEIADVSPAVESMFQLCWPGPVTFVLPAKSRVIKEIHGGTGFVGLRCSDHPFIKKMFQSYSNPVVTTSANLSGKPPAETFEQAKQFSDQAYIAKWNAEKSDEPPSTVIKVDGETVKLLREGGVSREMIEKIVKSAHLKMGT